MTQTASPPTVPEAPRPGVTVPDLLRARAESAPESVALHIAGSGPLTFGAWDRDSRAVAAALIAAGVLPGDRVALLFAAGEWADYAAGYLGVLRAGAVALHLNDRVPDAEVARRVALCEVTTIVHSTLAPPPAWFTGRTLVLDAAVAGAEPTGGDELALDATATSDILFTSGTTGPAKAYVVPHDNLTFGREPSTLRDFQGGGHMLVPMTLGTSTSATCLIAALSSPAVSVMCDPDDIEAMGALIDEFAVSTIAITPWIATQMVESGLASRHSLASVTVIASGSSPLPPALARTMLSLMPQARVMSACSQSEAGPALVINIFDPERPLSVGRPSPATELRLVDDRGDDVPAGEIGQIWLRHKAPRRMYLDESRNLTIRRDGFYRTGDYGRLGDDGSLYFIDRGEDLLQVGGRAVSSVATEAALYEHPGVREAAVVQRGEDIVATVVLRPGADLPAVQRFAAEQLPDLPNLLVVAQPSLPRSQNGKVLKRDLREGVRPSGSS